MKSNPLRILETLDSFLRAPFSLYIYGRSALALGYPGAPADYHATMDVDAILPARDVQAIEANEDFWAAQERVNAELGESGLYFTHLFEDRQVILTPDWIEHTAAINVVEFRRLILRRPSTADLILTKMMRVDPQDRDDIEFLLRQSDASASAVRHALDRAVLPDVPEIAEAFWINRAWVERALAGIDHGP
jgi:hypothetical protein